MTWKISRPGSEKLFLSPEALAVVVAVVLVAGLFAAMVAGGLPPAGTPITGPDGCTAYTWRNPVNGRTEAIGRSRLDTTGRPVCR